MKENKWSFEIWFIAMMIMVSETLKDHNDSILIYWYQWFMPGFKKNIVIGYEEMWSHVIVKKLPYFTLMIIIISLSRVITLLARKEDYSDCNTQKEFLSKLLNDDIRSYIYTANFVLLCQQIYYQIVYKVGFPFIYGPLFVVMPVVYFLYHYYATYKRRKWKMKNSSGS